MRCQKECINNSIPLGWLGWSIFEAGISHCWLVNLVFTGAMGAVSPLTYEFCSKCRHSRELGYSGTCMNCFGVDLHCAEFANTAILRNQNKCCLSWQKSHIVGIAYA